MYRFNQELVKKMLATRIPRWDDLPNFEVSNEQVISIVEQTLEDLAADGDQVITKRMINNYVKWERLPKPKKKKYKRLHVACCMVMSILKPVLSSGAIYKGIEMQTRRMGNQGAYDTFCEALEAAIKATFAPIYNEKEPYVWEGFEANASDIAINSICRSLCYKIITDMALRQEVSSEEEMEKNAIYLAGEKHGN